jgi:hypothetical protein
MNERLSEFYADQESADRRFVCECGDGSCTDGITLTGDEYRAVRGHPTRFAIIRGHQFEFGERVVASSDGFAVVEKPLSL